MSEEEPKREKNKGGRPKIPLVVEDLGELEQKLPNKPIVLADVIYWIGLGATEEEIAGAFYCSVDTLCTRIKEHTGMCFSELKKRVAGAGKIQIRKNQMELSKTNASMGIWLGKCVLGQQEPERYDPTKAATHEFIGALASYLGSDKGEMKQENEELKAKIAELEKKLNEL